MRSLCLSALFLLAMGNARAADWTVTGEAGLVIADGNTNSETANAKLLLASEEGKWVYSAGLSGLYASTDGERSAQRWEVFGQSNFEFTRNTFTFGAARYEQDEFSAFEYQGAVSGGLGRYFIDTDRTTLTATAGIGYKYLETRDAFDNAGNLIEAGESGKEVIARGKVDFEHALTESTSLIDNLTIESGSSNTYLENIAALKVKMNERLALALGYTIRRNTNPTGRFEKTDRLTTVNLVYEFK